MTKILHDRWEIKRQIGEGGQGWTYVVTDNTEEFDGELVLKRLKNVKRKDRFEDEIKALRSF
jgi:serine/threonine protein kinase